MDRTRAARLALGVCAALALGGCTPSIGDSCVLSTDCSLQGDRVCDNAQPNGYCTMFNCATNSCPDNAACLLFHANVPGCPYDGYQSPSRTARSFCLAHCQQDSDCRQSDGYVCVDATQPPWNAIVVDTQWQRVCMVRPDYVSAVASYADAAVCSYASDGGLHAPAIEAGVVLEDGGADTGTTAPDAQVDAPADAPADVTTDAAADAADASVEAQADAGHDAASDAGSDASVDAPVDAVADAGAVDAPGGG